jgi:hypothetical protein
MKNSLISAIGFLTLASASALADTSQTRAGNYEFWGSRYCGSGETNITIKHPNGGVSNFVLQAPGATFRQYIQKGDVFAWRCAQPVDVNHDTFYYIGPLD